MHKIRTLHYLRGIAALLVLYAHVVVVGITDPVSPKNYFPMIPGVAFPPELFAGAHYFLAPEIAIERFGINAGHLGVAAFFLISGYVIMRSLDATPLREFAIGRFFRIMPSAAAVTIGGAIAFSAYTVVKGFTPTYTIESTLLSALLLPSPHPPNPVIWSLIVEAWFYAILAGAVFLNRGTVGLSRIVLTAAVCLTTAAILATVAIVTPLPLQIQAPLSLNSFVEWALWYISYNLTFVIFILAGSAIYRARQTGQTLLGAVAVALILGMFYASCQIYRPAFPDIAVMDLPNAIAALALFMAALIAERFLPRIRPANFFADISYPLYLVHVPLSWLILHWGAMTGISGPVAMALTIGINIALAYVLHITIENPSHKLGKAYFARTDVGPSRSRTAP
jgi:peptidoglycan/LPS O-acetylase OafA/YrhL